jgi:cell wall-associated NlpC family hydrolase
MVYMKRKSFLRNSLTAVVVAIMTFSSVSAYAAITSYTNAGAFTIDDDNFVVAMPIGNSLRLTNSIMSYLTDVEGTTYGPEDFYVDGSTAYILNTVDNTVLKFSGNVLDNVIALNDIPAIRIAAGNGDLFVLGSDLSISKFAADGKRHPIELSTTIGSEAIMEFSVIGNYIYLTTAEGDSGKTYKISTNGDTYSETFDGRVLDETYRYAVKLLPETGYSIGHSCLLLVQNNVTGQINSVLLSSDYWVFGAQLLGVDEDAETYSIKLYEMAINLDYTTSVEETIRVIDYQGETAGIRPLARQYKSVPCQTKVINSEIYQLDNLTSSIGITELALPSESSIAAYSSPLAYITESAALLNTAPVTNAVTRAAITRDTIIANAKVYHTAFSWTCTAANIAAMTGYTKPRYINGAGTYQCMPYCWGGFNTTSQFTAGLNNGGRAGNIDTSSSGLVSNTYGLDCSGFVSRAWGLSTKYSTSTLPNISTVISASALQKGDILNKPGDHVVLFEKYDSGGNYILYEATLTSQYDRVAYTIRSVSSLSSYTPRKYNDVI